MNKSEYASLHYKLNKKYGKAKLCENPLCKFDKPKRFEWALRKGRHYSLNITDYIQFCPSCHRKYDETTERRKKLSNIHKGKVCHNMSRRVAKLSKEGTFIEEYISVSEAARKNSIWYTAIWDFLGGRRRDAGGFLWRLL